jgi:hypothetical protein
LLASAIGTLFAVKQAEPTHAGLEDADYIGRGMVNARMVNAPARIFRRRIFANLLPIQAEFHDSRIRLNILAGLRLTIKRCIWRLGRFLRIEYYGVVSIH